MADFVHLHNHSEYSLLDGAARVADLVHSAKALDMPAVALTDHGVMHGVVEFYRSAHDAGIKPIIGCEVYVAPHGRFERSSTGRSDPHHLLLLAKDNIGYHNLMQLCSRGHTEGFYYRPRIDWELLQTYHQGLIVCSACIAGEIPRLILLGDFQGARRVAAQYKELFTDSSYYLELQDHLLDSEKRVNRELIRIAAELDIPLVATNDVHYIERNDADMHDLLLCIQTASRLDDGARLRFPNNEFYLKSAAEMSRLFASVPEALRNTVEITQRCDVKLSFGQFRLPRYPLPTGETEEAMLRRLVAEGLCYRYGSPSELVRARAEMELDVIASMGFCGYFLIVWDFIDYAKSNAIDVGPGRGSVIGSLVAYALRITEVDPLEYDLLFERFLNPERISMPDIDIDFCFERRSEVIDYVARKYGRDHVAQIITFGTMGARGAVRDVARALGISQYEVNRIAAMIPFEMERSIEHALSVSADLRAAEAEQPLVKRVLDLARKVEGKPRNVSMHAAGVVITPEPLHNLLPLLRPRDEGLLTQYAMGDLEALGFLKMDFLGLRTLTILRDARQLVLERTGRDIELAQIPLDDAETYRFLATGETDGVFQLESSGMRRVLRALKPTCIEDIIATNALYRPGPMQHIPEFVAAKAGKAPVHYLHPILEPILAPTYGVLVYQEQVMRIAHDLAGFSLGQADLLRRAMAKRDSVVLKAQRDRFVEGAVRNGVDASVADQVFALIVPFGAYGFNKSHSTAYGILAYQTAWYIVHHPLEYGAAMLTSFQGGPNHMKRYLDLLRAKGFGILPPSVNKSRLSFSAEGDSIRFSLLGVRQIGIRMAENLVREREQGGSFRSLHDFCIRLSGDLNRRSLDSLIRAGAFDEFDSRSKLLMSVPRALLRASGAQAMITKGQTSLVEPEEYVPSIPETANATHQIEFSLADLQAMEQEATGFVFTLAAPPPPTKRRTDYRADDIQEAVRHVRVVIGENNALSLEGLKDILRRYPGDCPVYMDLVRHKRRQLVPRDYYVFPTKKLQQELERALGKGNVFFQSEVVQESE